MSNHDLFSGEELKEAGTSRAREHASPEWKDAFRSAVTMLAAGGNVFTSEDVIASAGLPPGSPSAVGAMMNAAARKGVIVRVGLTKAKRSKSHAAMLATWQGGIAKLADDELKKLNVPAKYLEPNEERSRAEAIVARPIQHLPPRSGPDDWCGNDRGKERIKHPSSFDF